MNSVNCTFGHRDDRKILMGNGEKKIVLIFFITREEVSTSQNIIQLQLLFLIMIESLSFKSSVRSDR